MELLKKTSSPLGVRIYAPKWIVFVIDVMFSALAVTCAMLITMKFMPINSGMALVYVGIAIVSLRIVSFLLAKQEECKHNQFQPNADQPVIS